MKYLLPFVCCLYAIGLFSQPEDDEYFYGFKGGVIYSSINEIGTTIIPEVFPVETYMTQSSGRLGFVGGVYFYHRFDNSRTAIQPEILFSMQGGNFEYTDINELEYLLEFDYQYINLGAMLKLYPTGGLHFAVGPQIGFNITNTNIKYSSNMPDLGPDLQIQQSLREVLKGKTNFAIGLGAGYDFEFGLSLEGRYNLGVKDVIETLANGFNFIENDNRMSSFQFTVGWMLPFIN